MGKYTKMALVLLYLLQLVIVFRDQLTQLYRSAIQSVQRSADQAVLPPSEGGLRGMFGRAVKIGSPGVHASLAAAAAAAMPTVILTDDQADDGPEEHHDDDDKKDRARRHRHRIAVEFLICNLWHSIRNAAASPAALAARTADVQRVMLFADTSSSPAKA